MANNFPSELLRKDDWGFYGTHGQKFNSGFDKKNFLFV